MVKIGENYLTQYLLKTKVNFCGRTATDWELIYKKNPGILRKKIINL